MQTRPTAVIFSSTGQARTYPIGQVRATYVRFTERHAVAPQLGTHVCRENGGTGKK
ncbi:Uncharacterised protein [Mycolicibacterium tokaiense]|uniref:Uncharacterized protein n=1 Tax=Mycolicibacterium tokaiense TaxID=39695 RepID=A0A378THI7_9MYCO|nr:Uncharacterised protein [Mycolicibacterium tokaiense]